VRFLRLILVLPCVCIIVSAQDAGRSTVSIGAGGGFPAEFLRTDELSHGPAFSATYEFRLFRYLAPEIGLLDFLPNLTSSSPHGTSVVRERVTLLSFGVRGILPLARGKVELFAGPSAVHIWSDDYDLTGYGAPSWLIQIDGGFRVAIDRKRHFWVGPRCAFARDGGRPTEEWVSLTGDFGFRF
jgi:hypothetical protein